MLNYKDLYVTVIWLKMEEYRHGKESTNGWEKIKRPVRETFKEWISRELGIKNWRESNCGQKWVKKLKKNMTWPLCCKRHISSPVGFVQNLRVDLGGKLFVTLWPQVKGSKKTSSARFGRSMVIKWIKIKLIIGLNIRRSRLDEERALPLSYVPNTLYYLNFDCIILTNMKNKTISVNTSIIFLQFMMGAKRSMIGFYKLCLKILCVFATAETGRPIWIKCVRRV